VTLLRSGARLGRLQLAAHRLRPVLECAGVDADAHPGPWRGCRAPALVGARAARALPACAQLETAASQREAEIEFPAKVATWLRQRPSER